MPPVRTVSSVKPVKTERTHEENQERFVYTASHRVVLMLTNRRAYIAASRRSDRSLEARIESARRASEIHKRRTGRSLRVTEQDVINEEMYEEEDDDLPMQYRRLTAHLQTQNADFDRRLAAYLTNHVAMRSALGQAVSDAWQNNQFNNIGQFMNPAMMQQQPSYQQGFPQQSPQMPPPQSLNRSPTNYRQSPYPLPNAQNFQMKQPPHGRSISTASPAEFHKHQQPGSAHASPVDSVKPEDRRMSMPQPQTPISQNGAQQSGRNSPAAGISRNGSSTNLVAQHQLSPQQQPTPPQQFQPQPSRQGSQASFAGFPQGQNMLDPLTTTLPMESQQLLAGAPLDLSDPMGSMFMPQQSQTGYQPPKPMYSYNPNGKPKSSSSPTSHGALPQMPMPVMGGVNQTLAPSMIDTGANFNTSPVSMTNDSAFSPFTPAGMGFGFNDTFTMDPFKDAYSQQPSGQMTPGETDWNLLVNDSWDEQPVA